MDFTRILKREIHDTYRTAATLMGMVGDEELDWRPDLPTDAASTGWMTFGQLLQHMTTSCGWLSAILTSHESVKGEKLGGAPNEGEPPAVSSVADALKALEEDRLLAVRVVEDTGEGRLSTEVVTAPWGVESLLGEQVLDCVKHLGQHKGQLFYYLKLRGRPVHTGHLWGLET